VRDILGPPPVACENDFRRRAISRNRRTRGALAGMLCRVGGRSALLARSSAVERARHYPAWRWPIGKRSWSALRGVHKVDFPSKKKKGFILSGFHTVGFNSHLHCYKVTPTMDWFYKEYKDLISFYLSLCRIGADGNSYVSFKHIL